MIAASQQRTQPSRPTFCALALAAVVATGGAASGQRVQIPASSADAFAAPALPPAAPSFDPYALGPPPATSVPYSYSPPVLGPQTVVPSQPFVASPGVQTFAPPPAPAAPTATASPLFSGVTTPEWQSGTYQLQGFDGTYETFTKFLAELSIDNGYLYGDTNDIDDLEVNELEIASTFTYPLGGSLETPLLITPGIGFNFFDGPISSPSAAPRGPDIPALLYDAYLDTSWFPHPLPAFSADLGFRVGVYSDFDFVNSDSVRFLGRGLGVLHLTPTLDLVAGVVYLDRIDISLLPSGGIHYRPNDVWDFYAVFPTPRMTRKLPSATELALNWFVAGEYGGGSWTANRAGMDDRFDYNDLRITTGFEWESPSGRRGSLEIGYVFDRELVFDSGEPAPANVDDTFLLRAGIDL